MNDFEVSIEGGADIKLSLKPGEMAYVLGANGVGKSTLLYAWARSGAKTKLISGNREVVFKDSSVSVSAADAKKHAGYAVSQISTLEARHTKNYNNNESWLSNLIFSIKSVGDYHNDQYRKADQENRLADKIVWHETMPLERVNNSLRAANFPLTLSWSPQTELIVSKDGVKAPYGIDKMSDGERAALILSATVILADKDITILIDEPERHLHRAISSPLINSLRSTRPDLSWIISTHDISLPKDDLASEKLVLYGYTGEKWNAELMPAKLFENALLADAIYGARRKILFVEGDRTSLDLAIYNVLFKGVALVPVESCRQVRSAVIALNEIYEEHHVVACGLVDSDNRVDVSSLRAEGIVILGVYAIESVYYHPYVIEKIIETAGTVNKLEDIFWLGCKSITDADIARLANDADYKRFRLAYMEAMPSVKSFRGGSDTTEAAIVPCEDSVSLFKEMVSSGRWGEVVGAFKIKSTRATKEISKGLGYTSTTAYELAVIKLLERDEVLREKLREIVPDPFSQL